MKPRELTDKIISLRQTIEGITEPNTAKIASELLNFIEELAPINKELRREQQCLKDEINRLKGKQSKSDKTR